MAAVARLNTLNKLAAKLNNVNTNIRLANTYNSNKYGKHQSLQALKNQYGSVTLPRQQQYITTPIYTPTTTPSIAATNPNTPNTVATPVLTPTQAGDLIDLSAGPRQFQGREI